MLHDHGAVNNALEVQTCTQERSIKSSLANKSVYRQYCILFCKICLEVHGVLWCCWLHACCARNMHVIDLWLGAHLKNCTFETCRTCLFFILACICIWLLTAAIVTAPRQQQDDVTAEESHNERIAKL